MGIEQKNVAIGLEFIHRSNDSKDTQESWHFCQMALSQFAQARWINPKSWEAYYYEGEILKELGLLSEAAERLEVAIKLKPTFAPARQSLGMVRMMQAVELFQKAA
jgi:tetratricopeptide (TPR) repeat protein